MNFGLDSIFELWTLGFSKLLLEQAIDGQADEDRAQDDGYAEDLFLYSPLGRIRAAALPESRAQARAAALLQKHQPDYCGRDYDLKDGDDIVVHKIKLNTIIINVVIKSGRRPWILSSGIRASASQTIDISITRLNKFKVKIRRGSDRIFRIGAMARLSRAMMNPVSASVCQLPE